jgi:hypothetical protein
MKLCLTFLVYFCWVSGTLADEQTDENLFIYNSLEARTLAISALSASVASFTYPSVATAEKLLVSN